MNFLTAAFYTHTHKKWHQTFALHTQNSTSFVLRTQKSRQKKVGKKEGKKATKKVVKRWQKMWKKIVARKVGKQFIPEPVLLLLS